MSIDLFNEIAVSGDNSLNPGRVPLECLRHVVPVEGPNHLLDLQDQVLGFIVRLCLNHKFRDAQHKIVQMVALR
jgi:hypothetical protein